MKAICNCGKELIFDKEVNEWACINCGYMYDEYELINRDKTKSS